MLNVLTAHGAEAAPFIKHYAMTSVTSAYDQIYFEGKSVRALVTGQGGGQSGASLSKFCDGLPGSRNDCWLNFGLAGSSQFPLGQLVSGTEIEGPNTGQVHLQGWPQDVLQPLIPATIVRTVENPDHTYELEGVYEMEAAILHAALLKHDYHRNLAVIKLVSDGPERSAVNIKKQDMIKIIANNSSLLTRLSDILLRSIGT